MNKMINFDDENKEVEITIGGEVFRIKRITVRMRADFSEIELLKYNYNKTLTELKDKELKDNKDGGKRFTELAGEVCTTFAKEKYEKTMSLLEVITSKNGYYVTSEWWEDNCDFRQIEGFILACINKDDDDVKKKEVNEN